ncbi:MAG: hypothetical protein V3V61_04200 [Gammaproteobacteria bacterium]
MDKVSHLVKFVKYDHKTIESVINKTIRFSTVYEFNDFNERHIHLKQPIECTEKLKSHLENPNNREALIKRLDEDKMPFETIIRHRENMTNALRNGTWKNEDEWKRYSNLVVSNLACLKMGIFCASSIKVFDTNNSKLMVAHYADNLKGLAMIYKYNGDCLLKKVKYGNDRKAHDQVDDLIEGKNLDAFSRKFKAWKYEKEYRIFSNPGLSNIEKHGLELKEIFYTDDFDKEESMPKLTQIIKINDNSYEGKLFIARLITVFEDKGPGVAAIENFRLMPVSDFIKFWDKNNNPN